MFGRARERACGWPLGLKVRPLCNSDEVRALHIDLRLSLLHLVVVDH